MKKLTLLTVSVFLSSSVWAALGSSTKPPLIFGHRGASGHRPEHTLESYRLAIEMGADFIEPDLVSTKDGVLIARHENEISQTTDVAEKFPARKTSKLIDGQKTDGWFTEDFTLSEIKTLRAKERLDFRDQKYNGQFEIPTFKEVLALAASESKKAKRTIGVIPETKHPTYFQSINLALEEPLIKELEAAKLNTKKAMVIIQSFELANLKKLKRMTPLPLVFLIDDPEKSPYDFVVAKDKRTYLDLVSKKDNLKEIAQTAKALGPYKRYIIPASVANKKEKPTELVQWAHSEGLKVYPYTFRSEERYLLEDYAKDPIEEYLDFYALGVDGVFSDFPDVAFQARQKFIKSQKNLKK